MLPPNLMAYWVVRRQILIPLSDAEKNKEREDLNTMHRMLEIMPKLFMWSAISGLVLVVFIVIASA